MVFRFCHHYRIEFYVQCCPIGGFRVYLVLQCVIVPLCFQYFRCGSFRAAIRRICPTLQNNLRSPDYGRIHEFTRMHRLTPSQGPERSQDPKRHTHNKRTCQGKLLAMTLARKASSLVPAETGGEENAGARRLRLCQCSRNTASAFLSTCLQVSLTRLANLPSQYLPWHWVQCIGAS